MSRIIVQFMNADERGLQTLQELIAIMNGPQLGQQLGKPQLILVMLPANAADCRRTVKHWGDIKMTISTQCVVSHARRRLRYGRLFLGC